MTDRDKGTKGPPTPDSVRMRFNRTIVRDVEARAGKLLEDGVDPNDRTGAALGPKDVDETDSDAN